tara:strand:+ start:129 stop:413 length:285 start_codon:yes stop_codon:yes gene_type:complete
MSDMDWTLSFLSEVAGQITTSSGEGSTTRLFAWASPEKADYWLFYIVDDNGKQGVRIVSFIAPHPQLYSVIGYCEYHGIQCEVDESMPEEDSDE